jgi:hypothetical protein
VALAIGAEKLTHPDKSITFGAYASGVDVEERERLQREAPKDRSLFMDIYAERARSVEKDTTKRMKQNTTAANTGRLFQALKLTESALRHARRSHVTEKNENAERSA